MDLRNTYIVSGLALVEYLEPRYVVGMFLICSIEGTETSLTRPSPTSGERVEYG